MHYGRRMTLKSLGDRVWWWDGAAGAAGPAATNMGVIGDDDGLTIVDTGMVRPQWEPFADAVKALDIPVRRIVLTSGDIWHVGGTRAFTHAAVYATPTVSALLDQPLAIAAYQAFMPEFAEDFDELAVLGTRPATHLVDAPAVLTERIELIPAPGHTAGDCVVLVPGADVCFTGSLVTVGTTPLCFAGNPNEWIETLTAIEPFATRFVPGRGPIGSVADLADLRTYLLACISARGDVNALTPGPWDAWSERRFDAVNVECAALRAVGNGDIPPTMRAWITPAG